LYFAEFQKGEKGETHFYEQEKTFLFVPATQK
jgi:hypothetical protein